MTSQVKAENDPRHPHQMLFPCSLCGREVLHSAVVGPEVGLAYRAREDLNAVWLPTKHGKDEAGQHIPIEQGGCPDLSRRQEHDTERLWGDALYRASWRAGERERRTALRGGRLH